MDKLLSILKSYKSVVLGFSGGCDSSLLLYACAKADIKTLAVTFHSIMYPHSELEIAVDTAKKLHIPHRVISFDPLSISELRLNPKERCYICKKSLFTTLTEIAENEGYGAVVDGSNIDDLKDYRPGFTALQDLGVKSPLVEAGFTKEEIRLSLKDAGLPQWNKPSFACYFSRFPYGVTVDEEAVKKVAGLEEWLHSEGLSSARVRVHGSVSRIETGRSDMLLCVSDDGFKQKIIDTAKESGFIHVCLDLEGYRTGSMNEQLYFNELSSQKSAQERAFLLENAIQTIGVTSARIFPHGDMIRIETDLADILPLVSQDNTRLKIIETIKKNGFIYICLDLESR